MMMLTLLSSLRGLLTILHAYLIADFVHSKPPGRKMVSVMVTVKKMSSDFFPLQVTSDINVYASIFSDLGKFIKDTKWIVKFNISIFLSHIFYVNIFSFWLEGRTDCCFFLWLKMYDKLISAFTFSSFILFPRRFLKGKT